MTQSKSNRMCAGGSARSHLTRAARPPREAPLRAPSVPAPMLAAAGSLPANEEEYAFELKWDGIRALAVIEDGRLQLFSRNGHNITDQYPEIRGLGAEFPTGRVTFDGEVVAMGPDGQPSFSLLQQRMNVAGAHEAEKRSRQVPVVFVIFDVLDLNGVATASLPYVERRRLLDGLELTGPAWCTPPSFTTEGAAVLEVCRKRKLEGVIAKRLDSVYEPGARSRSWIKVKLRPRQELVIGGWLPGQGGRGESFASLLVGYYDVTPEEAALRSSPQRLIYAGRVGTGFTEPMLVRLAALMRDLRRASTPFAGAPPVGPEAVYVEPVLVAEFEFAEWTAHSTLRQPSFKGLRSDKDPRTVVRE